MKKLKNSSRHQQRMHSSDKQAFMIFGYASSSTLLQFKFALMHQQNFAWDIPLMNPYRAYAYDVLHRDDLGKWGHHLWELVRSVLGKLGQLDKLTLM
jgi:hypothetical protein